MQQISQGTEIFGTFRYNKRLYTEAARRFFDNEDLRNPAGHEPDWNSVVAGPPQSDNQKVLSRLLEEGYVGLYNRLPDQPVVVPSDHDPRRTPVWVQVGSDLILK